MLDRSLSSDKVGDLDFLLRAKRDVAAAKASPDQRFSENTSTEHNGDPVAHKRQQFDKQDHRSIKLQLGPMLGLNIFGEQQPQLPAPNSPSDQEG
jgi:hypothetical protein